VLPVDGWEIEESLALESVCLGHVADFLWFMQATGISRIRRPQNIQSRNLEKDELAIAKNRRAVLLLKVWMKLPGLATPGPSGLEKPYHELSSLP
jgi:hypothetical protein